MAQASVDRNLGSCLLSYKNSIFHELSHQQHKDHTVIPELMFSLLHFLKRILERDLPEILHDNATTCHCRDAIHSRFYWIVDLDILVSDYLRKHFSIQDVVDTIMCADSPDCFLLSLQKKYHFVCSIAFGAQSYYDRSRKCIYMKV